MHSFVLLYDIKLGVGMYCKIYCENCFMTGILTYWCVDQFQLMMLNKKQNCDSINGHYIFTILIK